MAIVEIAIFLGVFIAVWLGYPLLSYLIGRFIWRLLKRKGVAKPTAFAISTATVIFLISVPLWDYLQIRQQFDEGMANEGGVKIFRVVSGVEGVHGEFWASQYGYCFGEQFISEGSKTNLVRNYKSKDNSQGNYKREVSLEKTLYGIRHVTQQVDGILFKTVNETYVVNTGEILGRNAIFYTDLRYGKGGYFINSFRPWMRINAPSMYFQESEKELLHRTLIPSECEQLPNAHKVHPMWQAGGTPYKFVSMRLVPILSFPQLH